jgi:23S rRNA pseudouridine1911/1915/1917 synthase
VRRVVEVRRVRINGELWLDPRRLKEGDLVEVFSRPRRSRDNTRLSSCVTWTNICRREKPSGISTMRHPTEREWTAEPQSTDADAGGTAPAADSGAARDGRRRTGDHGCFVHRLDKETSGLLVIARTVDAERHLGRRFKRAHGRAALPRDRTGSSGTADNQEPAGRDRGDGRRGSTEDEEGKEAITHVEVRERLRGYTVVACRLETGRTHQIRIHLSEAGHPVCGERCITAPERGTAAGRERRPAAGAACRRAGLRSSRDGRGDALVDAPARRPSALPRTTPGRPQSVG